MMHVFIIFTNKSFAVSPAPILRVVQACWHVHVMRRGPELLKSGSVTCSLFNRSPHPGNYVDTNRELLVKGCLEEKIPSEMEIALRYIYADYTVDIIHTIDC